MKSGLTLQTQLTENVEVLEYEVHPVGLGATITLLSMLLSADKSVRLYSTSNCQLLHDLKQIFNIPNNKLTIIEKENVTNNIVGYNMTNRLVSDYCKFWSPYISSPIVNLFGSQHKIGKQNKPCIAVANAVWLDEFPNNSLPYNRYHTKEFWQKSIDLILSAGYDVITLNLNQVSLEQKTYILNELCDAVLGYEGGLCHLAHLLKVPTIMLPWHHHEGGNSPDETNSIRWIPQKMHLDKKTYFLQSPEELLSWTADKLKQIINGLYQDQGNSIFFNSTLRVNQTDLTVDSDAWDHCGLAAQLTDWEKEFVFKYINSPTVGGT